MAEHFNKITKVCISILSILLYGIESEAYIKNYHDPRAAQIQIQFVL